ncbi:MAG TPA: hypothetical protein VE736_12400 [Gaiellaceae bacterium]|jgi:hypothetical protein|nr:hypothetical protein [Gaiellaceae bacterium]
MRRLAVLVAFLVFATGAPAANSPRYAVATVETLDGSVSITRDTATGTVTFLPADPGAVWRVLDHETLATYANGQPATVFVFHPPFDAWTWLDYWYGFAHADVEAALAQPGAARTEAPATPPLESPLQIPEPYDFFGANVNSAAAVEPFRFAYAGGTAGGLPLWNVYVSRLDDPATASVVVEYTRRREGGEIAVETLRRAVWPLRAWRSARPLTHAHGIPFRYAGEQIYGRTRVDWIVVHGTGGLSRRQRIRLARAIRFR